MPITRKNPREIGSFYWSCYRDLNLGPRPYQGRALPLRYISKLFNFCSCHTLTKDVLYRLSHSSVLNFLSVHFFGFSSLPMFFFASAKPQYTKIFFTTLDKKKLTDWVLHCLKAVSPKLLSFQYSIFITH